MSDQTRAQIIEAMAVATFEDPDFPDVTWGEMSVKHPAYVEAFRKDAKRALDAALPLITAALAEKVRDDVTEGDSDEHVDALMRAARLIEEGTL